MEMIVTNSPDSLLKAQKELVDMVCENEGGVKMTITRAGKRSLSMLKLWRLWMIPMCEYMNNNGNRMPLYFKADGTPVGSRAMTVDDCHHAFSALCLGCDENGVRLSWAFSEDGADGKRRATTGERLRAMDKLWLVAFEKGIPLQDPSDSEYRKLKDEQ
jgi:hypothetical protein